ncbi:MAG: triose-phosphate isomerase, partial [Vicinamibacteria bacterium]
MADRTPLIAGNWKMNKTAAEAVALATEIRLGADAPAVDVLVSPPFTALVPVAKALEGSKI